MAYDVTRRSVLKTGSALAATGFLAGCLGDDDDDTIRVGTLYPQTGPFAGLGRDNEVAIELAVEDFNDEGGINDIEVETVNRDSQADPGEAVPEARDLLEDEQVDMLLGPISSAVTDAVIPEAEVNGVLMASSDPASPFLTGENCSRYFFRFRSTTEQEAIPFSPWLYDNIGETIILYYSDYAWGHAGVEQYGGKFEDVGGEVVDEIAVPLGETDQSEFIAQIDTDADILFPVMGGTDSVAFLDQAHDFGIVDDIEIAVPGGDFFGANLPAMEEQHDGIYSVASILEVLDGPWDTSQHEELMNRFEDDTGDTLSNQGAKAYTMATQIFTAAEDSGWEGRDDTSDLIEELRGNEYVGDEFISTDAYMREDNHQMVYDQIILESVGGDFEVQESFSNELVRDTPTECEF